LVRHSTKSFQRNCYFFFKTIFWSVFRLLVRLLCRGREHKQTETKRGPSNNYTVKAGVSYMYIYICKWSDSGEIVLGQGLGASCGVTKKHGTIGAPIVVWDRNNCNYQQSFQLPSKEFPFNFRHRNSGSRLISLGTVPVRALFPVFQEQWQCKRAVYIRLVACERSRVESRREPPGKASCSTPTVVSLRL